MAGEEAWLNPPRETMVPESEDGRIVVLSAGTARLSDL